LGSGKGRPEDDPQVRRPAGGPGVDVLRGVEASRRRPVPPRKITTLSPKADHEREAFVVFRDLP
jgi:hypothetical protein